MVARVCIAPELMSTSSGLPAFSRAGITPATSRACAQPDGSARVPRTRAREHEMRPPGRRQRRHQASCLPCARAPPDGMRAHRVRIAFELVSTSLGLPAVGSAGTSPAACRACALVDGCERVHHTRARTHGTEAVRSAGITPASAVRVRCPTAARVRLALELMSTSRGLQPSAALAPRQLPAVHTRQPTHAHRTRAQEHEPKSPTGHQPRWLTPATSLACAPPSGSACVHRTRAGEREPRPTGRQQR